MNLQTSLLRQLSDEALTRDEQARLRCQLAKELEETGDYEAARGVLGELWQRVGERPQIDGLDKQATAEILLRAGVLSGWIGSAQQIKGAQEMAKDLISESITVFESLQEKVKVAEALTDLAVCYWREGAYGEARVLLQNALSRLDNYHGEIKAVALLRSALVEREANRLHNALRIHTDAAPLFEASHNHVLKAKFHGELAVVLKNLGEAENREDYLDQAIVECAAASFHFEQAGHTRYCARVESNLGFLFSIVKRFDEAHEHLNRARRLFVSLKDKGTAAQVDDTRARVLLAQGKNYEAEKLARLAVCTLEQGDEQSFLAGALTTHGTALARLGHHEQSSSALQHALEVAHLQGDSERAGQAALAMIEELGAHLTLAQLQHTYERADQILANSQDTQTLSRLRQAARRVLSAGHARHEVKEPRKHEAGDLIHTSVQMAALMRDAHRIASGHGPILITGETGTGKKVLARMIHEWSGRVGQFVEINCAMLKETPTESELFGHARSNSGAEIKSHPGAVREARGGTLFLDDVTELSRVTQSKLLRLIEHGEIQSIGASKPERVNVRIIVATDGNLKEEAVRELLRDDLFYRLKTFHLEIPPLRERPGDIPAIARQIIKETLEQHARKVNFVPEAIEALKRLQLRGNAHELRSLIERTVMMAHSETNITRDMVETIAMRQMEEISLADAWAGCSLEKEVLRYERSLIKLALEASNGSITRAARLLGITYQGLAYILQGRHKDLLPERTPVQRRRRSLLRAPQHQ